MKVSIPNVEKLRAHFAAEGRVAETVALRIIKEVTEMLTAEPTVLDLDAPLTGTLTGPARPGPDRSLTLTLALSIILTCTCCAPFLP